MSDDVLSVNVGANGLPAERDPGCLHCALANTIDAFRRDVKDMSASAVIGNLTDLLAESMASTVLRLPMAERPRAVEAFAKVLGKELRTRGLKALRVFDQPATRN